MFHIIDDQADLCQLLVELFEAQGESAKAFTSAIDYLHFMEGDDYSVPTGVIVDIKMPEMNGYELMDKVLERYPEIRFAMISGDHYQPGTQKHQACMYLLKPIHSSKISEMLDMFRRCTLSEPGNERCCMSFSDHKDFGRFEFNCPKA